MLLLNNVIVPPEYVFRRVGLCMWRQIPICGARIVLSAPQAQRVGEEEEAEEDADGADRQSWESQIEFWYNKR
jgi:hypothetical protein